MTLLESTACSILYNYTMNPKYLDNINNKVIDDLCVEIRRGSKISMVAASFSIYAYQALKKELSQVDEFHFIFMGNAFAKEKQPNEPREFYIPRLNKERSLYGTDYEIKLKNELNQQVIAKECADWIRAKAKFRSNLENQSPVTPSFAVVSNGDEDVAYNPLMNFATADLGLQRGNNAYSTTMKFGAPMSKQLLATFNELWNDQKNYKDVTDAVLNSITAAYKENSPELIYYLALYNIFREFLDDINEDYQPREVTGFKNSEVWNKLYDFQKDAVLSCISKLEKHNGCILADSVGLGKTFTALGVIKYYECRNDRVLVLCPKRLSENWNTYKGNYRNNPLANDRLNYDVLYHTDLLRTKGESNGQNLQLLNWDNYDLVVIDESHNFRNGSSISEDDEGNVKFNRYETILKKVIDPGAKTKVLMLSATPVNTDFTDLKNQLMIACDGDSDALTETLDVNNPVDKIFADAGKAFHSWAKLPPTERTAENLLDRLNFDFYKLLDSVTIARSRKHIEKYYHDTNIGKFPTRLLPINKSPELSDEIEISLDDLFEKISLLNLDIYAPLKFVHQSRIDNYKADTDKAEEWRNREDGRVILMRTNLLKRLESSVHSFRLTLQRMEQRISDTISLINNFEKYHTDGTFAELSSADGNELDYDDQNSSEADFSVGKDQKISLGDMDYISWRYNLLHDKDILDEILDLIEPIVPDFDKKLQTLLEMCTDKVATTPYNPSNRKIIIFTAFADTADYLYDNFIQSDFIVNSGLNVAEVTGGGRQSRSTIRQVGGDFNEILAHFSPISKDREVLGHNYGDIDILIATDCISEGQNLQDCDCLVNYDIHWNPIRLIQRFGRIDRLGSKNDQIQMVNFWPSIGLDEYIDLKRRVQSRMELVGITSTGENVLTNTDTDLEYRRKQLQELQSQVVDLEDMNTGVSITDLGLSEFQLDLRDLNKKYGDADTMPHGINAIAQVKVADTPPGVIFVLRNVNNGINIDRQNRLHPFYLVYVSDDGQVVVNHLQPKDLLDRMRYLCRDNNQIYERGVAEWKQETNDGHDMSHYAKLLTSAVQSIVSVKAESEVDSLFSTGGTTALTSNIAGLDDFELIDMLIIRE